MTSSNSDIFNVITKKYARPDAIGKVTGATRYCTDMKFEGMLYGAIHQSSHPHAKVLSIDVSDAEKAEGVVRVFTNKDIPGEYKTLGYVTNIPTIIKDEVRYMGDVIAFVVADTEKHARAAAKKIHVEYEPLPVVTDPVESMSAESPRLGQDGNVCNELHTVKGDVEEGFKQADVIIERVFRTQFIEHEYMETECAIAVYNGHEMVVYGPAQYAYEVQKQVAETLGFDLAHVIVEQTPIGGSYGGKAESMNVVSSLAALGAYHLNKPVLLKLSREESMYISPKRHPFIMHYKAGVKKDGTLTAIQIKNVCDTGPYPGNAPYVLFRAHGSAPGPYNWHNWKVDGYMVLTNNGYGSAMRGFGNPQVIFATESMMDELAEAIGMDPIELRLKNAFEEGSVTMTDQVLENMPVNFKKVLERVREISDWDKKRKEYSKDTGRYRRGIG
ncbi:MAG: xanthine dehydrogenase family protein molybdopterin-binding subunit, partial [Candidatus Ranarchaeia archaeon]